MGTTRKAMRVGKQAEHFVTIKNANTIKDDFTRILTILKASGLGLWLVYDTLGFLHSTKTIKLQDAKKVAFRGNQCWLAALVSSFALNIYKMRWNMIKLDMEVRVGKPIPVVESQQQYALRIAEIKKYFWIIVIDNPILTFRLSYLVLLGSAAQSPSPQCQTF